jgi:hypothetical protein
MAWLEAKVGLLTMSARGIAAVGSDGFARGVVAYDDATPNSLRVHVAADSVAAILALRRAAFAYPFLEQGKSFLLASIPSHRWQAVRLAKIMGLEETARVHDGYRPGSDLVSFCLHRKDCRFLKPLAKAA